MRIASLLPSATELVCALGAGEMLVGRSHECDFPPGLSAVPVLTEPRYGIPLAADEAAYRDALRSGAQSHSAAIDATIQTIRLDALSPYLLNTSLLADLQPELVLTQDLCDVCAPTIEEVRMAVREHCGPQTRVLSLTPQRLNDIRDDFHRVADAIGLTEAGVDLRRSFEERLHEVRRRVDGVQRHPSVLCLEWFDPPMSSGLWVPDLIDVTAGLDVTQTAPGTRSRQLSMEELAALDPDVILLKPCGFKLERGLAELPALAQAAPWGQWRAVREGRAFLTDGSAYFNRPGPRIADSCEILASLLHPALFPDVLARHDDDVLCIGPDMEPAPWQ
jgi:iron complex transport system substrate-binding protein